MLESKNLITKVNKLSDDAYVFDLVCSKFVYYGEGADYRKKLLGKYSVVYLQ